MQWQQNLTGGVVDEWPLAPEQEQWFLFQNGAVH
jgi:hypothetical protein